MARVTSRGDSCSHDLVSKMEEQCVGKQSCPVMWTTGSARWGDTSTYPTRAPDNKADELSK